MSALGTHFLNAFVAGRFTRYPLAASERYVLVAPHHDGEAVAESSTCDQPGDLPVVEAMVFSKDRPYQVHSITRFFVCEVHGYHP